MDYKETLNLPETSFAMKANLPASEPIALKELEDVDIYKKIQDSRKNAPTYILHDGPPYANGNIHLGTALNKILKDIIIKIKTAEGFRSPYIPGWDCHGLPIELQVDKQLGSKKDTMTTADIRKECRSYASKFIDIQRNDFKQLFVFGDWQNPYITMDFKYEATTVNELYKFFENGGVYRGSKPVYWCHSCVTALAEAEVEYADHTSYSVYVKFPISDDSKKAIGVDVEKLSAVIWTTTPWTLPANLAIAVNPVFDYAVIQIDETENKNIAVGEAIIIAKEMIPQLAEFFSIQKYTELKSVKGSVLENLKSNHPFYNRSTIFALADYVTLEAGTGLVHTAPAHGQDDYITGLKYNLDSTSPVDGHGKFFANIELFGGKHINDASKEIVALLDSNATLLARKNIKHSYPHCWRCKSPVIFRATPQWFISMSENDLRKKAISAIENDIKFIPSWGKNRIFGMIENRPDWCISRQRIWGVPIAVFSCADCGEIIINEDIKKRVVSAFEKEGSDAWYIHDNEYFLGKDFTCPKCSSKKISKEKDILDVWFDSGVSHAAVCEVRPELKGDIDMYLEGSDQHRGWFHSSLLESIGTRGKPPYKEILTHGFVVDGNGKKMSKSIGNTVNPVDIINKYGVEILRLWVSAEDYTEDIRISDDIIKRLTESYRKIRNTARYILGNLNDFDPKKNIVEPEKLMELDYDILARWQVTKSKIYDAFKNYQFHIFYHTFLNFCITELSSYYLDIIKDRVYSSKKDSAERRSAQTAMYILIKEISIIIAPVLSHTAHEIYKLLPLDNDKKEFVFLELFPKIEKYAVKEKFNKILEIRKEVMKVLEIARQSKIIGHPLDAEVTIFTDDSDIIQSLVVDEGIEKIFIVSKVTIKNISEATAELYTSEDCKIKLSVAQSGAVKCERCWTYSETVGVDSTHPTLCKRCSEVLK